MVRPIGETAAIPYANHVGNAGSTPHDPWGLRQPEGTARV